MLRERFYPLVRFCGPQSAGVVEIEGVRGTVYLGEHSIWLWPAKGSHLAAQYACSSVFLPIYLIDPILAIKYWAAFPCLLSRRSETNSVAVKVEAAAGRRVCVFRDGLRERVARLFKGIFAGDGLGVAVKELALGVDV